MERGTVTDADFRLDNWQDRMIFADYLEGEGREAEAEEQRREALIEQVCEHIVYGRCDRFLPIIDTALRTRNKRLSDTRTNASVAASIEAVQRVGARVRCYGMQSLARLKRREEYTATVAEVIRPGVLRLSVRYTRRGTDHVCEVTVPATECYLV